jgi:2-C-methyl-D-erythritol 4-phosphate cytidylyltransferase
MNSRGIKMLGLFKKKNPPITVSAVIVAAGAGTRMGGVDKQQILIEDIPIIVRSVQSYMACPRITEIIVVCRDNEMANYLHMVQDFELGGVTSVVAGGTQRQDSVFAGIEACSENAGFYAIHDGARPLVTPEIIDGCIDAAVQHGAAAAGVPVKDTIKVITPEGFVQATPDRAALVAIQTPQVFEAGLYKSAMVQAKHYKRYYTDDCQLVEQAGKKVFIAGGSYENIKITTPEDVATAQVILAYRAGYFE